jgi:hypothetical protein
MTQDINKTDLKQFLIKTEGVRSTIKVVDLDA